MLLASCNFYIVFKGFRSFNNENLNFVGQRALKLPAIKLWEWFDRGQSRIWADWFERGRGRMADFFLRPPTLTAGNFEALQLTDPKSLALKNLYFSKKYDKYQETSYDFRLGFFLSNRPHLHKVYFVTVRFHLILSVYICLKKTRKLKFTLWIHSIKSCWYGTRKD